MKVYCIAIEPINKDTAVGGSDWFRSQAMRDDFLKTYRHRHDETHRFTPFTLELPDPVSRSAIEYAVDTAAWDKTYVPDKEETL